MLKISIFFTVFGFKYVWKILFFLWKFDYSIRSTPRLNYPRQFWGLELFGAHYSPKLAQNSAFPVKWPKMAKISNGRMINAQPHDILWVPENFVSPVSDIHYVTDVVEGSCQQYHWPQGARTKIHWSTQGFFRKQKVWTYGNFLTRPGGVTISF